MTKWGEERIFCGTPTRGTSKGEAGREAARSSGTEEAVQAEVECKKRVEVPERFQARAEKRAHRSRREKISPGGGLREERVRMGRGRDACCGGMRGPRGGVIPEESASRTSWHRLVRDH